MCGGFSCSKNTLIGLNIFYILLGILLIYIGKLSTGVTSLPIIGGILACGIILILISVLGLIGAVKHHQVILFFYMIILFILFIIQFSIACSCLAVNSEKQKHLAEQAWITVNDPIKAKVQEQYNCCGFNSTLTEHPVCLELPCCVNDKQNNCTNTCKPCLPVLTQTIDDSFRLAGTIGLFFSFTELVAIFVSRHYRNQQDPEFLPIRAVFPNRINHQY